MARINDLLRQLEARDPALANEISREMRALSERRAFGLNFERHTPEQVELPGRPVRKGGKVNILPPRGEFPNKENKRIWLVDFISTGKKKVANLIAQDDLDETCEVPIEDLVVVAEFRDPIYPGLVSTGKVERGGEKPFHTVINGENFHALEALLFTHRGKVDAIYIDPPYNTGARDWKYNNDYVESDDIYRHSKWLAFMERRLQVAKELLNAEDSVLIVTIDEKEYLRLGLLLEQTFPESRMQMISSVINPGGSVRQGAFSRTDEYIFVLQFGDSEVIPLPLSAEWRGGKSTNTAPVAWRSLSRGGDSGRRKDRPNMFYPIFVYLDQRGIASVGEPISLDASKEDIEAPAGQVAVWPMNPDGSEGRWRVSVGTSRQNLIDGFIRANYKGSLSIQYLAEGFAAAVRQGDIKPIGRDPQGHVILGDLGVASVTPGTAWNLTSHNSRDHGSSLLAKFLPGRKFPYPKSVYAVEDILRFFVQDKKEGLVLDFFAGSGTSAHAVMRLNRQDGGRRQSISVTNNEVGSEEHKDLTSQKLRPGDAGWEHWGICEYITKPRIRAAITGQTSDGVAVDGAYRFTDEFGMSEGFEENAEFFKLTYEAPMRVQSNREFSKIAPFLWLRAGSRGRRIESLANGWDVSDSYGVLENLDSTDEFLKAMNAAPAARIAYIVTDEDRLFEAVVRDLPTGVEPVRLYQSYLSNFEIEAMRRVR